MIKNTILILTMILFTLTGCGAGGGSTTSSTNFNITSLTVPYSVINAPTYATKTNTKRLADTIVTNKNSRIIGRSINTKKESKTTHKLLQNLIQSASKYSRSYSSNSCVDYRVRYSSASHESSTITYNSCNIDGTIMDGIIYIDAYGSDFDTNYPSIYEMELTFATDMTLRTDGETTTIYRDGKMVIDRLVYNSYDRNKIDNMRVISSLFSNTNGTIQGSYMLVATYEKLSSSRLRYSLISGRQYIENGYFTVSPNSTSMIFDGNILLPSGVFKYSGAGNSKVEVEASGYDELTLYKDEDGDGIFEYSEVINL